MRAFIAMAVTFEVCLVVRVSVPLDVLWSWCVACVRPLVQCIVSDCCLLVVLGFHGSVKEL